MKYREVIAILENNGFSFKRTGKGSHRIYEGYHTGKTWGVVLSYRSEGEDVKRGILNSIIRQSGLPKDAFR